MLLRASATAIPLGDETVQTCVTSPPYWGLRSYSGEQRMAWGGDSEHEHRWGDTGRSPQRLRNGEGSSTAKQAVPITLHPETGAFCECGAWNGALGLEPTPELYVEHMVAIFREVRRVLRPDGTLWLNLGDSYASAPPGNKTLGVSAASTIHGVASQAYRETLAQSVQTKRSSIAPGLKPKDLVGIPWRVAFALQAAGWWLRSDIVWSKPNPMPESVTDRPTKSHEYLFLLTKSERYYFDADAVREGYLPSSLPRYRYRFGVGEAAATTRSPSVGDGTPHDKDPNPFGRNIRSVWEIATRPYAEAHFATFPPALPERCILAGSAPGDVVLDPFSGSGTAGMVAERLGRRYVGLDLSTEYIELAQRRIAEDTWQPRDRLGAAQAIATTADGEHQTVMRLL